MPSTSFSSSSLPFRQLSRYARHRPKYSAARAFYISIVLVSALALWGIATYRDVDLLERESHRLIRRTDVRHDEPAFGGASHTLKKVDLEASLAS